MQREELYHRSHGVLTKAFMNGSLKPFKCTACAVGNLVAAGLGYTIVDDYYLKENDHVKYSIDPAWQYAHNAINIGSTIYVQSTKIGLNQIEATGYTPEETNQIELAFMDSIIEDMNEEQKVCQRAEGNYTPSDESLFKGLCAVIDTLDIIHENTDKDITGACKQELQDTLTKRMIPVE